MLSKLIEKNSIESSQNSTKGSSNEKDMKNKNSKIVENLPRE